MTARLSNSKALRIALSSAVAAAMLTGCAGSGKFAEASSRAANSSEKSTRAVTQAEKAVERNARDAGLRVALGQAYLNAGRFDSAASAFNDALALGDTNGATALRLALSEIGAGNRQDAVAVLDEYRDTIPASDLGLALALAGETARGVTVLADTLRAGDDTPKTRQNLAYAYALDGRWREARVMAAQDVPADQLDARISDWAMQGRPEDFQNRVASLLDVQVRPDPGQPERLALSQPTTEQVAVAPEPIAQPAAELPAIAQTPAAPEPEAIPAPIAPKAAQSLAAGFDAPAAPEVQAALEPVAPAAAQSFAAAFNTPATISQPVVQPLPMRPVESRAAAPVRARAAIAPAATGSHFVQLGSFSSEQNARRAWGTLTKRNPELRDMRMVITPATVRGKNFWRVAVAGYSAGGARRACDTVRVRGGVCFAYAATNAPAGARPMPSFASARR